MIEKKLATVEIEEIYDLIADGVDRAGEKQAQVFLAKLSLILANQVGDVVQVTQAVHTALRDL